MMDEIQGTCMTMCSEAEIRFREKNNLLHPFEMIPGTSKHKFPKADKSKMVKEYTRPAAGKLEPTLSDLRPGSVLLKTVRFLMENIVPNTKPPWSRIYEYVFDRLRAVRQDMVIQRINGSTATAILEIAVRFHIYAGYVLCEENISEYDDHINNTHTQECLKRLLVIYAEDKDSRRNMAQFISLYLIYNLGNPDALQCGLSWKSELYSDMIFRKSLNMSLAMWLGNNVEVFKLARSLPPIHMCAFHRHISVLQRTSLQVMSNAYCSKNLTFSLDHIQKLLWFNDINHCKLFCEEHGLSLDKTGTGVVFNKVTFQSNHKLQSRLLRHVDDKLKNITPNMIIL